MSTASQRKLTVAEYLAREEQSALQLKPDAND